MNVLWITNILLPEANAILCKNSELKATGGWLIGAANMLAKKKGIKLTIVAQSRLVDSFQKINGKLIRYYAIPSKYDLLNSSCNVDIWNQILNEVEPDVVHIHGTECPIGLSLLKLHKELNTVISIQGMTSVYADYYTCGLNWWQIVKNLTLRDFVKGSIFRQKELMKKSGEYEKMMIHMAKNVIGRTDWDKAHVWSINPNANYHFCNETLREEFYSGRWDYKYCKKHSIFVSQASYPIKGLHQLIKALPYVLREFPDTTVNIAGVDVIQTPITRRTGYHKLLSEMIAKYNLASVIHFTGPLNAEEMKQAYLKTNVFVSSSNIENSPNSVGEAQILGVPTISSYVGGVHNLIPYPDQGILYRFEDTEMLAFYICRLFGQNSFDNKKMIEAAKKRHSQETNANQLLTIYEKIIKTTV